MKRTATAVVLATLLGSGNAWAQAAIPECRAAAATLQQNALQSQVGVLVSNNCPQMYSAGWLTGTGTVRKDGNPTCDSAWSNLQASLAALGAAKEFVTRNCPAIYMGLGWRTGPAATAPIPACEKAEADLNALGKLTQASNALKQRCIQLYQNSWLVQLGGGTNTCETIWSGLTTANALAPARELLTHNCPSLYTGGFVTAGSPIRP